MSNNYEYNINMRIITMSFKLFSWSRGIKDFEKNF
jgi:hypothetical protein